MLPEIFRLLQLAGFQLFDIIEHIPWTVHIHAAKIIAIIPLADNFCVAFAFHICKQLFHFFLSKPEKLAESFI